jgi:hypothetical protein
MYREREPQREWREVWRRGEVEGISKFKGGRERSSSGVSFLFSSFSSSRDFSRTCSMAEKDFESLN